MENFLAFIASIAKRVLRTNSSQSALHQTDRNVLRADTLTALAELFKLIGVPSLEVKDGIAIELPNDELGSVVAVLSLTIKDLDFDIVTEHEDFVKDKAEKAEAKAKKEAETLKKKAEVEANKAKKKVTK